MEIGLVRRIDIEAEMQQSYLDYAMSVIVARALPDARDGLKPVHRRILHAMHAMGVRPDGDYKKSARIVGEVLGKYHPHSDMAVYDAMARMAQPFSMRYPLIDGQGNFGSMDGDPPAAMRYTEARSAKPATEMLADLEKDTVNFSDNFDGTLLEPDVLPAALPNLLVNGQTGIAVGMSTSVPPHNLSEVCNALSFMLINWSKLDRISTDDLMKHIQGPDFPTGGIILREEGDLDGLITAYATGRGKITLQARAHVESMSRGRSRIIVTELPYQTNKANLIERIADLARSGQLEGLADLRDESDRQGMRIVIELVKSADPEKVLAELYRRTPMQGTFSVIMLALVDGEPRLLSLKQALKVFIEHRLEVVRRRSEFDLARARERAHILEGLRVALANLDAIIDLIRNARDANQARTRLKSKFKLSDIQALAILDMPLRRLASLERKKIEQEYKDLQKQIKSLESLLASSTNMRNVVKAELEAINEQYGDRRRTQIVQLDKDGKKSQILTATDIASEKETWVVVNPDGKVSRTATARLPRISGRDAPQVVLGASGTDTVYLFNANGQGASIAAHTLPIVDDPDEGAPLTSVTPLPSGSTIVGGIALDHEMRQGEETGFLVFGTRSGMVKKTALHLLPGPSARAFTGVKVGKGDALGWVCYTTGDDDLVLVGSGGMAIRFSENDVRPMGLEAGGVNGIKLEGKEQIVGMDVVRPRAALFILAEDGRAKRTTLSQFPTQGRYGKGVLAWKSGDRTPLAGAAIGMSDERAAVLRKLGAARSIKLGDAKSKPRAAAGEAFIDVADRNRVTGLRTVIHRPQAPQESAHKGSRTPPKQNKSSKKQTASRKGKTGSKKGATTKKPSSRSKK